MPSSGRPPLVLPLILIVIAALGFGAFRFLSSPPAVSAHEARYVGRTTCARCHAAEEALWHGSDHDRAMDVATPETVLGDFDDAQLEQDGVVTTFRRDGERFVVNTVGADGSAHDYEVRWVFGFEPLQQYLVEFDDGRVQCLRQAWDTEEQRWFALYPDEHVPPGDELFWTGPGQNWNWMCADCHSTGLRRGYDPRRDTYDTTFEEIDVSCEACHGPGSEHVAWAESSFLGGRVAHRGLVVPYSKDDPTTEIESCAPCHSRRGLLADDRPPGGRYDDDYRLSLLEDRLYHTDGQILDEVYVYGSFLQSRMHHEGVRCSDCHDPHSTKLRFEGNALCTQCHVPAVYDTPTHHHHAAGTVGASCQACHMPERTYMVVDERSDHSFRVPRPDLTVRFGVPNTCSSCHAKNGAQWAADRIAEWTGRPPYESEWTRQGAWAEAFAAARAGRANAGALLEALAGDATQPAIVRATALAELAAFGPAGIETARAALSDADAIVRSAAVSFYGALPPDQRLSDIAPLTADPSRRVRTEAARVLAPIPAARLPAEWQESFERATQEFVGVQEASLDRPEGWLMLGVLAQDRRDAAGAEAAYRHAIRLDPRFVPARMNLAVLLDSLDRTAEAEEHLRAVLAAHPDFGEAHYSLGLTLAALGRPDEAEAELRRAAQLMPDHEGVKRNLERLRQR